MREEFKLAMKLLFEGLLASLLSPFCLRLVQLGISFHLFCAAWDFFTDTYVLVTKVIYANEPCKSKVAHLVIPWLTVCTSLLHLLCVLLLVTGLIGLSVLRHCHNCEHCRTLAQGQNIPRSAQAPKG